MIKQMHYILILLGLCTGLVYGDIWDSAKPKSAEKVKQKNEVTAIIDRSEIEFGERFKLTITSQSSTRGRQSAMPEIKPLTDEFVIHSRRQSTNISVINNQVSQVQSWIYILSAKHEGKITIPSVKVGSEKTKAIEIRVHPIGTQSSKQVSEGASSSTGRLFMDVVIDNPTPYVREPFVYTIRVYYNLPLTGGGFELPELANADIQVLGQDKHYKKTLADRHYDVIERHHLITPKVAGELVLKKPKFTGIYFEDNFSGDPFDSFFRSPAEQSKVIEGQEIKAMVKPAISGENWFPAKNLTVKESWQLPREGVKKDLPVTREITIEVDGQKAEKIPDVDLQVPAGIQVYPDKPTMESKLSSKGYVGRRVQRFTYMPTKTGLITLPAISVEWFNTKSLKLQKTTLPGKTLEVQPPAQLAPSEVAQPVIDGAEVSDAGLPLWVYFAFAMGAMIIMGLVYWVYRLTQKQPLVTTGSEELLSAKAQLQAIEKACFANDHETLLPLLLRWAKGYFGDDVIRNVSDIHQCLPDEALKDALDELCRVHYAKTSADWDGETFWQIFKVARKNASTKPHKKDESGLPPLYPE